MKKFIALALTLAMLVSCLVFTASAESGVAVALQGPATAQAGAQFQVEVRVTDANNVVGGVQGVLDVTGATVVDVQVNEELQNWNKTSDNTTIYKTTDNDITFAALNSLEADTHDTRLWFKVTYEVAADATDVSVNLANVKVSDKSANLITDVATSNVAIDVVDPVSDPVVTLNGMGMPLDTDDVMEQALMVDAGVSVPDATNIAAFGVVFYPTSLLGGAELTVATEGAIIAEVSKESKPAFFNQILEEKAFLAKLNFGFTTKTNALKFLGTKVTARVYYKTTDGAVVYSANNTNNKYIKSGTAKKAALNVLLDNGANIENHTDQEGYDAAVAGLSTSNANWEANREFVLKYVVANYNK